MARRITRISETDSLKDAKRKEDEARVAVAAAEKRAKDVGDSIIEMQKAKADAEAQLNELKARLEPTLSLVADAEQKIQERTVLLRQLEESIIAKGKEVEAAHERSLEIAKENEERLRSASQEFLSAAKVHSESLNKSRADVAASEERKKVLSAEIVLLEETLEAKKRSLREVEASIASIASKQVELEKLESTLLQKRLEVGQAEERMAHFSALAADEKNKYEEAKAFRNAEEARVAELQGQLAAREEDIASKFKQLRAIKESVDLAVARILRKEHDDAIRTALRETYNINI